MDKGCRFLKQGAKGFILALLVSVVIAVPVFAATTADVTITWTPTYLAMTNSEATWAIGTVVDSTAYWWTTDGNAPAPEPFEAADMKSTVTNTGSIAEDFDMHTHAATGGTGWTVSTDDTPGATEFSLRCGRTGTANEAGMIQIITTDNEIIGNLASLGTMKICLELETGTTSDGVAKSTTATITCRAVT